MGHLDHYFLQPPVDENALYQAAYNPLWVAISVLLSFLAAYAALIASDRIDRQPTRFSRLTWISISALTLGLGIWSMHFIGMLALNLPCRIYYDPITTLISMVPGILASGIALGIHWQEGTRKPSLLLGSLLLGSGIGTMHYTGMAAMRLDGMVRYNPELFGLSLLVAIILSFIALKIKHLLAHKKQHRNTLIALIIGAAASGMHYTAMFAAYFVRGDRMEWPATLFNNDGLGILIALTTVFLALAALTLAAISNNREVTEELRQSEERWKFALEGAGDGVWDWNPQTGQALFSKRWKSMLGFAENELLNNTDGWLSLLHPADKASVLSHLKNYLSGKQTTYSAEFRMRCKNGAWKWILARGMLVNRDQDGSPLRMIGTHTDIDNRKQTELELRIAATAFESREAIMITDANNNILRVNPAFSQITGYGPEEVIGQNPRILSSGRQDRTFYTDMWHALKQTGAWSGEIWNQRKSGEQYPQNLTISAVKNTEGSVTHYVASLADITHSKEAAEKIERLAFYDPLTGLPNRRLLHDRLQQAMAGCKRKRTHGVLFFLDMDNFKMLNDTHGHAVGDQLLQQVAQRLSANLREIDTVARLSGDEFVVLVDDLNHTRTTAGEEALAIGHKLLQALNQPYELARQSHHNTPSIGAILFDGSEQTIDELLKQADIAMYQAKSSGRNALRFFDPQMQARINARVALEKDLQEALALGQFELYFQAQICSERHIIGAEVLLRWHHQQRGWVSPAEFIPLAEETGLILPLGQWVLKTACRQVKAWENQPLTAGLQLSVNVSVRQFRQADFVEQVQRALKQTGINPEKLKLELTESLVVDEIDDAIGKMQAIRNMGIHFSMDDFGTGYSSLSSLKKLPLDQLKIDQSFVRDISVDPDDATIVQTIIAMAHKLGMEVVAEGVETEHQRQFLAQNGCSIFQGYLFSKPLPLAEFEAFLAANSN